jgi:hypothetical protein
VHFSSEIDYEKEVIIKALYDNETFEPLGKFHMRRFSGENFLITVDRETRQIIDKEEVDEEYIQEMYMEKILKIFRNSWKYRLCLTYMFYEMPYLYLNKQLS